MTPLPPAPDSREPGPKTQRGLRRAVADMEDLEERELGDRSCVLSHFSYNAARVVAAFGVGSVQIMAVESR